jgi:hypothetical protein
VVSTRESPPFAISAQPNNNIESVVTKTERVRVTLRAKADYSANFAAQSVESDLFIAVNSHRHRRTRVADAAPYAKFNLIGCYPWRGCDRLQSRGIVARVLRLRCASHFVQDLGEYEVLPGLIWFTCDGAALGSACLLELILANGNCGQ